MPDNLIDDVQLRIDASRANVNGLTKTIRQVQNLTAAIDALEARLSGLTNREVFKRSAEGIKDVVKDVAAQVSIQSQGRKQARLSDVAEALGFDPRKVEATLQTHLTKLEKIRDTARSRRDRTEAGEQITAIRGAIKGREGTIAREGFAFSVPQVTSILKQHQDKLIETLGSPLRIIQQVLSGGGGAGTAAAPRRGRGRPSSQPAEDSTGSLAGTGHINLNIPVDRIVAKLEPGTISLLVPADRLGATTHGEAGSTAAASTRRATESTGATEARLPNIEGGILNQVKRIERPGKADRVVEQLLEANQKIDRFWKEHENGTREEIKRVTTADSGATKVVRERLDKLREARNQLRAAVSAGTASDSQRLEVIQLQDELAQSPSKLLDKILKEESRNLRAVRSNLGKASINRDAQTKKRIADEVRFDSDLIQQREKSRSLHFERNLPVRASVARTAASDIQDLAQERKAELFSTGQRRLYNELLKIRDDYYKRAQSLDTKATAVEEAEQKKREAAMMKSASRRTKADEVMSKVFEEERLKGVSHENARKAMTGLEASGYTFNQMRYREGISKTGGKQTQVFEGVKDEGGMRKTARVRFDFENGKAAKAEVEHLTRALKDTRAEASAAGRDFIKNTAHVTAWAASVGVLYGTLGLVRQGLGSVIEIGGQMARLDQVFRHVGGTTSQLTNDVIRLAAANGRTTEEAMQSAVQWSRLGLTRSQVNLAVKTSLMAANVAEISAAEATEHLSGIMATYGLNVGNIVTVLAEMNAVSNRWNVTNKDLLDGISRTGAVAKQSGLSLHELIGIIGATVGATGQTGANIGNAVKSLTVALGNPEIQKFLRNDFQFEVTGGGGADLQSLSKILADLFVKYESLNDIEQKELLVRIAGKTQSNRVAAALDQYVQAMQLAIIAQRDLGSAEEENAKIKATLKSQLAGLTAEWERFVNVQANSGGPVSFNEGLKESTAALKNLLILMNAPGISKGVTILAGLTAVLGIKLAMMSLRSKEAGLATGFLATSLAKLSAIPGEVSAQLTNLVANFTLASRSGNLFRQVLGAASGWSFTLGQKLQGLGSYLRNIGASWHTLAQPLRAFPTLISTIPTALGVAAKATAGVFALGGTVAKTALTIGGLIGLEKAFSAFMDGIGASSDAAMEKLAGFNKEAELAAAQVQSNELAARLAQTIQRATPKVSDQETAEKFISQAAKVAFPEEVGKKQQPNTEEFEKRAIAESRLARETGDWSKFGAMWEQRRAEFLERATTARQAEFNATAKGIQKNEGRLKELNAIAGGGGGFMGAMGRLFTEDKIKNQIAEIQKQQLQGQMKLMQADEEQEEARKKFLESDRKHLSALEEQKAMISGIAAIWESIPVAGPFDAALLKIGAIKGQIAALKDDQSRLAAMNIAMTSQQIDAIKRRDAGRKEIQGRRQKVLDADTMFGIQHRTDVTASVEAMDTLRGKSGIFAGPEWFRKLLTGASGDAFLKFYEKRRKEIEAIEKLEGSLPKVEESDDQIRRAEEKKKNEEQERALYVQLAGAERISDYERRRQQLGVAAERMLLEIDVAASRMQYGFDKAAKMVSEAGKEDGKGSGVLSDKNGNRWSIDNAGKITQTQWTKEMAYLFPGGPPGGRYPEVPPRHPEIEMAMGVTPGTGILSDNKGHVWRTQNDTLPKAPQPPNAEQALSPLTGTTEIERLLNRQKVIESSINDLNEKRTKLIDAGKQGTEEELYVEARLATGIKAHHENIAALVHEQADVEMQINKLRIERSREAQRALLQARPGDLLQAMASFQLTSKGPMSAGQFLTMGTDMRRWSNLFGAGFDQQDIELRRAQRIGRDNLGAFGTVSDKEINERMAKFDEIMKTLNFSPQAKTAKEFADATDEARRGLSMFGDALKEMAIDIGKIFFDLAKGNAPRGGGFPANPQAEGRAASQGAIDSGM